jgi:cell pole-organizing protein PopZ
MSAANPKTQEPSMEEILASIRRIIADDQDGGKAAPSATLQQPARAAPQPPAAPARREEEVLDLAEVATPVGRRGPSLDLDQDDIDYREAREMDFDALEAEDDPGMGAAPEPPSQPRFEPESQPQPQPFHERLISTSTDSTVTGSFNMLAHTVLTQNARTLEDLVKEMLKPMLKTWLDDNLPTLVERLVRAEIERVTRGR